MIKKQDIKKRHPKISLKINGFPPQPMFENTFWVMERPQDKVLIKYIQSWVYLSSVEILCFNRTLENIINKISSFTEKLLLS